MAHKYIPKRAGKKSIAPAEVKKYGNFLHNSGVWNDTLLGYGFCEKYGWRNLSVSIAWHYYKTVSVVMNATDLKCENFANSIPPKVYDTVKKIWYDKPERNIPETQVLALYNTPNADQSRKDVMEGQSKSFEVTGNMCTVIKAINEEREPMNLLYINPKYINPVEDGHGGIASYSVLQDGVYVTYDKNIIDGKTRYLTKDKRWEFDHMKRFNPDGASGGSNAVWGLSPYSSLFYELEQLIGISIHNWSMLDKGATPSMVVTMDKELGLNSEQLTKIRQDLEKRYQGSENTGNVIVLQGGQSATPFMTTNREMQYPELVKNNKEQVYRNRNIPQSLITEHAKFNNLTEAKAQLYEMCIFPFADRYFERMNNFLMPRYSKKNDGRYILTYDKRDVPAMQFVEIETAKLEMETGVLKVDEVRSILGRELFENEEGEAFVTPSGVAHSVKPTKTTVAPAEKQMSRDTYIKLMKGVIVNGERKFTDIEVTESANKATYLLN